MKYDIFISYRREGTADKAEHLLSLLEDNGYKGNVSFDRENFDGTFDLQILGRIDECKDFIFLVGEHTFDNFKIERSNDYIYYAKCTVDQFDRIQKSLLKQGKSIDFVRFELARALEQGKNIIPIVPMSTERFDFDRIQLPEDINQIKRVQCVYYNNNKNFLFKSIMPDVCKRLVTRKKSKSLIYKLCLFSTIVLSLFGFYTFTYLKYNNRLERCRTLTDYESLLNEKFLPSSLEEKARDSIAKYDELTKMCVYTNNSLKGKILYNNSIMDSLYVSFSPQLSLYQLEIARQMFDNLIKIPQGHFNMGVDENFEIEGPRHLVYITQDFYISQYEVTRKEWYAFLNDSIIKKDPTKPITNISWNDSQSFINKLNEYFVISNMTFSIPSEAQWEYVAKAGTDYIYSGSNNLNDVININQRHLNIVGTSKCNDFNVYDMTGNVKEWCLDGRWRRYTKSGVKDPIGKINSPKHIIRGGSFKTKDFKCFNVAYRDTYSAESSSDDIGLRIILKYIKDN